MRNYLSNLDGDNVSKDKDKEPPIDDTNKWVSWYLRNNPSKSLKEAHGELLRKRGFRLIIG